MVTKIKKMTDTLVANKQLYNECGTVFTYLNELKINFANIDYHNIAWQYSQIVEIVYSNKLLGNNLNIFDVIIAFANEHYATPKIRQVVASNFDTTIYISDYRKKYPTIKYELFDIINKEVLRYPCYKKTTNKNKIDDQFKVDLTEYEKQVLEKLINCTYSNNGLYFIGLFVFLHTKFNSELPILSIVRSLLTNLYLMKTKLLFAPTLCISYPLYHNYNQFIYLFDELNNDPNEIIEFSRLIFDIVKQAAVVNRAFVSKATIVYGILENLLTKNKVLKNFRDKPFKTLFKVLAFNKEMLVKYLELDHKKDANKIIDELKRLNIIVDISNNQEVEFYMFKDLYKAIKALDKNKTQSTVEIFQLREKMN